mgnify:CR=1 FL=1
MRYTWRQKVEILPRVIPFLLIIVGVLVALYGGIDILRDAHKDRHDEEGTEHRKGDEFGR